MGLIDIGGTTGFTSGLVVKGGKVGKLALNVDGAIAETEALFESVLDIVSGTGATGCRGGTVEGKVAAAGKELAPKLVVVGINEEGYSGKFDACRLDPPVGKDELKPENCICGMEGGMASPGGGRSKDCCCICGSPLGAP